MRDAGTLAAVSEAIRFELRGNRSVMRLGRPSLLGIVYLLVGIAVAANKEYLRNLDTLERLVSALLAILLWPLLFLGVDLRVNF